MEKGALVDDEFRKKIEEVEEFCKRSTDTGGILLVTGQRGVGKTRLVDEALNRRRPYRCRILPSFFGNEGGSNRKACIRQPNGMNRYLIKVNVEVDFPYPKEEDSAPDSDGVEDPPNSNTLTYRLLRNIVFALTSSLDSRSSLRKYGKTLRARLGFWRYWFSITGLSAPNCIRFFVYPLIFAIAIIPVFISVILTGFYSILEIVANDLSILFGDTVSEDILHAHNHFLMGVMIVFLLCYFCGNCMLSMAFLRWLDWHALDRYSSLLFAQVNANEAGESYKHAQEHKREISSKLPFILVLVLLAFVLINDEFVRTLNVITTPSSEASAESSGERIDTSNEHPAVYSLINNGHIALVDKFKLLLVILLPGSLVAYSVSRMFVSNREVRSVFDQENPVWLVSLIRSYLFLCHRCGIEPVLVLDELDKLLDIDEYLLQRKDQSHSDELRNRESEVSPPDKLDLFLIRLARLKSSLGAEFLWILISGPTLYERLQIERHGRRDRTLGLLATVIQQEIAVGPVSLEAARKLLCETSPDLGLGLDTYAAFWLQARGVFATMIRMIESRDERWTLNPSLTDAHELAHRIHEIWNPDKQNIFLDATQSTEYHAKLYSSWVQTWIRVGMMDFGNRLLLRLVTCEHIEQQLGMDLRKRIGAFKVDDDPEEILALRFGNPHPGDPHLLLLLGERLLYAYLNRNKNIDKTRKSPYVCLTFNRRSGSNEL